MELLSTFQPPKCRCGATDNLMKKGQYQTRFGLSVYYTCRDCNTARCKKWRERDYAASMTRKANKRQEIQHPDKAQARWQLNHAVQSGKIKRLPCRVCGDSRSHGHHTDYSKPLEVEWLCVGHHADAHRLLRAVFSGSP